MIVTIDQAVNRFIEKRNLIKSGIKMTLDTGFSNLNEATANGLYKNTINTLAAHSGVGKTALSLLMCGNFLTLNKDLKILFFTLEMPSDAVIARFISRIEKKTVLDLNTLKDIEISDETYRKVSALDISFYEHSGNTNAIYNKIKEFTQTNIDKHCLVIIDHSLLIDGDGENQKITDLSNTLNTCKKTFRNSTYLIISQLNDAMYDSSRLAKARNVYPIYTDLYYGRTLFQISDLVMCMVKPADLYDGDKTVLYGPLKLIQEKKEMTGDVEIKYDIIYLFVIKGRDSGKNKVIAFGDNLKHNNLIAINIKNCKR